jgi:hypothetical protein
MRIAYYTSFFSFQDAPKVVDDVPSELANLEMSANSKNDNQVLLFSVWLYYLLKSGSVDRTDDKIYVITDEKMSNAINSSNIYKFMKQIYNGVNFINVQQPGSDSQAEYMKFFPPILDIMSNEKVDYIFYCDILNIIRGDIRSKLENKEELPTAYIMFERHIQDDNYYSYIKNTEWYSKNKDVVDKLPGINGSLFCIKNGVNEVTLLKSIFNHVANDYGSESVLSEVLYSHSQYLGETCYIELQPELFFKSIEVNKLDSGREIILLRNIDAALLSETAMILLLCKLENL